MTRSFPRLLSLLAVASLFGACGAAATLPPVERDGSLSSRVGEAVWYAENGDHASLAVAIENSILVLPPGDDSKYVNGAFSIDIPDRVPVQFTAKVGLQRGATGDALFSAYIQDGAEFPKLAEVFVTAGDAPADFSVDLSAFRGRSVLLILTVSSPDGMPLSAPALWIDPAVLTP